MTYDMDMIARRRIRTELDKNFFVEAGAGSGKTTCLVDRMVAMVEAGIPIDRICAITFTKAAAAEFYKRFQEELSKSGSARAEAALKDIDLCFMGTIDSFCQMVLSEHPAEAKVPSGVGVAEDDAIDAPIRREYSRMLREQYGPDIRRKAERFARCFDNGAKLFAKEAKWFIETRNAEFVYTQPTPDLARVLPAGRENLVRRLVQLLTEHPEVIKTKGKAVKAFNDTKKAIMDHWTEENAESLVKALKTLEAIALDEGNEELLDNEVGSAWRDLYEFVSRSRKGNNKYVISATDPLCISIIETHLCRIAQDLFADCIEPMTETFRKEGRFIFFDYLYYLRELLSEDALSGGKLAAHIYERHQYFLLDESQDTNPIQAELFFYLTADPQYGVKPLGAQTEQPVHLTDDLVQVTKQCGTGGADWTSCVPRPDHIFIVGDPKQSIYRFRNADVTSYINLRELFRNNTWGEVIGLTRNFRSTDELCGWFNDVFNGLLPEDSNIQSKFEPIPTGEKTGYVASLNGAKRYKSEKMEDIADLISQLVSDQEITIQDPKKGRQAIGDDGESVKFEYDDPRRVEYRDIMVITYTKTRMKDLMKAFKDAGIPYWVEGSTLFDACPALQSIAYLMRAAANPLEKKGLYAALNLSGCMVTQNEAERLGRDCRDMSPASAFMYLADRMNVFAEVGPENAEYVYYAQELLRAAQGDTVFDLADGADFVQGLISGEGNEERCIQLVRDSNRIHLANLHKVKGLEAPVVILAPQGTNTKKNYHRTDYTQTPPRRYVLILNTPKGKEYKCADSSSQITDEEAAAEAERLRLLYVAATRAGNALFVPESYTTKGDPKGPWADLFTHIRCEWELSSGTAGSATAGTAGSSQGGATDPAPGTSDAVTDTDFAGTELLAELPADDGFVFIEAAARPSYTLHLPSTEKGEKSPLIVADDEDDSEDELVVIAAEGAQSGAGVAPDTGDAQSDATAVPAPAAQPSPRRGIRADLLGTMIHSLMEMLVTTRGNVDTDALAGHIASEAGSRAAEAKSILLSVAGVIRSGGYPQKYGAPQDILAELLSAEEVHCEYPFCYYDEPAAELWNGVMDVVYLKDGKWHIVDYKTNTTDGDLAAYYAGQLGAYTRAFKHLTGEDADAKIYHIKM